MNNISVAFHTCGVDINSKIVEVAVSNLRVNKLISGKLYKDSICIPMNDWFNSKHRDVTQIFHPFM